MSYNYKSFQPSQQDLVEFRKQLYHSTGPGYIIFKQFIPPNFVEHLVEFWVDTVTPTEYGRQLLVDKNVAIGNGMIENRPIYLNCPNYYRLFGGGKKGKTFFNFFWNTPHDYLTHSLFFTIQMLRNTIETKPVYNEIFPYKSHTNRSAMNQIVITKESDIYSPPHRDWHEPPYEAPERLQATLFLTKKGVDYTGRAFVFRNNQGEEIEMDSKQLEINPGDLVLWRYQNEHAIYDVSTKEGQKGFARMIFPPVYVFDEKEPPTFGQKLKNYVGGSFLGQKLIIPVYSPIKKILRK